MKKETLTRAGVQQDLAAIARFYHAVAARWRFSYILPFTLAAVLFGALARSLLLFVLLLLPALYHALRYAQAYWQYLAARRAIFAAAAEGGLALSCERLSHITEETVYEPRTSAHSGRLRGHMLRSATYYYFENGKRWRLPLVTYYAWSREYRVSPRGLMNISISGDEFYYVHPQGQPALACIYPCKCFVPEEELWNPSKPTSLR